MVLTLETKPVGSAQCTMQSIQRVYNPHESCHLKTNAVISKIFARRANYRGLSGALDTYAKRKQTRRPNGYGLK
jgi:hypothetical protein